MFAGCMLETADLGQKHDFICLETFSVFLSLKREKEKVFIKTVSDLKYPSSFEMKYLLAVNF